MKYFLGLFSIFIGLTSLFIIIWYRNFYQYIPNLITSKYDIGAYDYIIVGAGTCGSVIASLLSEKTNYSVLLIEAGDKFGLISNIPLLSTLLQKGENDWSFLTVPQKHSSKSIKNQQQCLPRGKGLGGSSQLNFLIHFDGIKKDFDEWENLRLKLWNFESMKPYLFRKLTNRNNSNQLHIWQTPKDFSLFNEVFDKARLEFNKDNLHFHRTELTVKNGLRFNVYQKYLKSSFEYSNFQILTNTFVQRIIFKNNKVNSLLVTATNLGINPKPQDIEIKVNKEIILSAGAYQTPPILLRSGIGSQKELDSLNIPVKFNCHKIGKNLHDQMTLPLYVSIKKYSSLTIDKILSVKELWRFLTTNESVFSTFGVIGNIDAKNDSYGNILFGTGSIDERFLRTISNYKLKDFRLQFPFSSNTSQEGFVMLSTCYKPKSRGTIMISKNSGIPLIDPNYLSDAEDIKCLIKAVRTGVKIIESQSFKILEPKIHWPKLEKCLRLETHKMNFKRNVPNDLYIECLNRHYALTSHHPGGSCSLGPNSDDPVDQNLRLRGIEGLRIMDASVLPIPLSGPPNSILISMATKFTDELIAEQP